MSDCIKREDAIDVIVKHFALNVSRSYVENILDDIPSADVHGERKKITNDYINKGSTRDAFCHDCKGVSYRDCEYADTCHTQKVLTKQPSADVAEVVRCHNCKTWDRERAKRNYVQFMGYCSVFGAYTKGDRYCAWAERKDNE